MLVVSIEGQVLAAWVRLDMPSDPHYTSDIQEAISGQ
jgi:hypothetical protein